MADTENKSRMINSLEGETHPGHCGSELRVRAAERSLKLGGQGGPH